MRVFFCANQISLSIAAITIKQNGLKNHDVIFFDGRRCDITLFKSLSEYLIRYTKLNFLKFVLVTLFKRPDEVCVPHLRGGGLIKAYASYAKKLSAIDDGFDTFREEPKNIVVKDFNQGSNYYTFNYDIPLASWLKKFNIVHICEIEKIADSTKNIIDLNEYDGVLVESPGVEAVNINDFKLGRVYLVKHSNPNKSTIGHKDFPYSIGSEIALERSIKNYKGTLIIGESMTAIYALMLKSPNFKLIVALKRRNIENLPSLIYLVKQRDYAEFFLVDG